MGRILCTAVGRGSIRRVGLQGIALCTVGPVLIALQITAFQHFHVHCVLCMRVNRSNTLQVHTEKFAIKTSPTYFTYSSLS